MLCVEVISELFKVQQLEETLAENTRETVAQHSKDYAMGQRNKVWFGNED
jgi:hypothetical protein